MEAGFNSISSFLWKDYYERHGCSPASFTVYGPHWLDWYRRHGFEHVREPHAGRLFRHRL